ncbi:hypothetical protein BUALT_Bualt03G0143500 [Buddleja alternifolia]|uniref:Uncharacterized protein n=1 Tax=Buddleja alternifolia TaxID=168488 RepID=A0AAV6Y0J4_9LAMI|nr:hypothetical protein BUALT_Bualt03G0143500 [Buddleja alternifolia]
MANNSLRLRVLLLSMIILSMFMASSGARFSRGLLTGQRDAASHRVMLSELGFDEEYYRRRAMTLDAAENEVRVGLGEFNGVGATSPPCLTGSVNDLATNSGSERVRICGHSLADWIGNLTSTIADAYMLRIAREDRISSKRLVALLSEDQSSGLEIVLSGLQLVPEIFSGALSRTISHAM